MTALQSDDKYFYGYSIKYISSDSNLEKVLRVDY